MKPMPPFLLCIAGETSIKYQNEKNLFDLNSSAEKYVKAGYDVEKLRFDKALFAGKHGNFFVGYKNVVNGKSVEVDERFID
jgi:hypothetical protein